MTKCGEGGSGGQGYRPLFPSIKLWFRHFPAALNCGSAPSSPALNCGFSLTDQVCCSKSDQANYVVVAHIAFPYVLFPCMCLCSLCQCMHAGIQMRRCTRRYHRAIFCWYLSAVGFNNVLVLFALLYPLYDEYYNEAEKNSFGYKHTVQDELGCGLIKFGRKMQSQEHGDKAARRLQKLFRTGVWGKVFSRLRSSQQAPPPQQSTTGIADPPAVKRGRGRPRRSNKKRAGRKRYSV